MPLVCDALLASPCNARTTVAELLKLEVHSIVDARESEDAPLPIWVNGAMIGWAEFDVVGDRLAIRVTELR